MNFDKNVNMTSYDNKETLNDKKIFLEQKLRESGEEARLENYLR